MLTVRCPRSQVEDLPSDGLLLSGVPHSVGVGDEASTFLLTPLAIMLSYFVINSSVYHSILMSFSHYFLSEQDYCIKRIRDAYFDQ